MIGDSLAVGVGQARPECETVAHVGITSERYLTSMLPAGRTTAETAVISLGVNDGDGADTLNNLRDVRARIASRRVYWLLPGMKERVRDMIRTVAAENGDQLIDTRPHVGRDHLHPNGAGYQLIASRTYGYEGVGEEVALDTPRGAPEAGDGEVRRPLRAYATPAERIRRLRALRQAEGSYRVVGRPGGQHRGLVHAAFHGVPHGEVHGEREQGMLRSSVLAPRGLVRERSAGAPCAARSCVARGRLPVVTRGRG